MRKEEFGVGTFAHIVKRGARQGLIVRDEADRWRFIKLLRYTNDANSPRHWERDIGPEHIRNNFARPDSWKPCRPYVSIAAYCLMDNHFHLLVQEKEENGISTFMQRLGRSMAAHHNAKYQESGALFQGPYIARVVTDDDHLQYLATYI
ncbi:MAG: transposase, partial [Minisyncoccia bacterium]